MSHLADLFSGNNSTSYRVLGVGIIAAGLVVLTVALIMGIEFPQHVVKTTINSLCIQSETHSKYRVWVHDQYRNRTNRLYFWELKNPFSFLYNGSLPEERGPYVYREKTEKIGVRFHFKDEHIVDFYEVHNQTFDAELTELECGQQCTEMDEVTILNENYIRLISSFGSTKNYALGQIPLVVSTCMDQLLHRSNSRDSITDYSKQNRHQHCDSLATFEEWIENQRTADLNGFWNSSADIDFSIVQRSGLYGAFVDPDTLGSHRSRLINETIKDRCKCLITECQNLASGLQDSSIPHHQCSHRDIIASCGFIVLLDIYQQFIQEDKRNDANFTSHLIQDILCPDEADSCFALPDSIQRTHVIHAITHYLQNALVPFAFTTSIGSNDIVIRRNQHQLAKGYFSSQTTHTSKAAEYVKGFLQHVPSEDLSRVLSKQVALLNCYDSIYAQTNFKWHGYDGRHMVEEHLFPNLTSAQRLIRSWRDNYAPKTSLTPCASPAVSTDTLHVFLPEFQRKIHFTKYGSRYTDGTKVDEFIFNKSNVEVDNVYVVKEGLQDMSAVNGYPSWISLPHFLYAADDLQHLFNMSPDESNHMPKLFVEPITGNMWYKSYKYQKNVGITLDHIDVASHTPILHENVTAETPLPVFWVEYRHEYNEQGIEDYHNKVTSLMTASCGGLVSLTIIAALLVCVGVVVMTRRVATNRVSPALPRDVTQSNGARSHATK